MLARALEWAVVAVPTVIGLIQWLISIREPKRLHRNFLLVGCLLFSALIWWQQGVARQEHSREMGNLPTKEDIKKLPTASDIVKEFQRFAPGTVNETPWGMTDEQLLRLSQRVSIYASFTPDKGDLITAVLGDHDSIKFAQRLAAAFRAAHWKNVGGSGFGQAIFDGPIQGIVIQIRDKEDRPPGLSEFVSTLRESGLEPTGQITPSLPRDEFRIIVGSRPSQ